MYRSSSMTFVYKYLFTPIMIGGFSIGIISNWNATEPFLYDWSRASALMIATFSIWMVVLMIRLKSTEATEEHFIIKNLRGQKIIDYKDIEWVSQMALINPILISMKYLDKESGQLHKILIIPSTTSQMFQFNISKELEMTTFIRDKIIEAKPAYAQELEPSRWLPVGLIILSSIPAFIMMNKYFFNF